MDDTGTLELLAGLLSTGNGGAGSEGEQLCRVKAHSAKRSTTHFPATAWRS